MSELMQISSALPQFSYIKDKHVLASRRMLLTGVPFLQLIINLPAFRLGLMFSRLFVAIGVMLVFGPMFAPVAAALFPGKESWPFSLV